MTNIAGTTTSNNTQMKKKENSIYNKYFSFAHFA